MAAQSQNARKATDGIGPSAETEQEDPVAGTPQPHESGVAIDEVAGDTEPSHTAESVVDATHDGDLDVVAGESGAEAGVVERQLIIRIDGCVRTTARGSEELVDVAPEFVDFDAAGLPCAVREDEDVAAGKGRHPVRGVVVVRPVRRDLTGVCSGDPLRNPHGRHAPC